jgi:hypothetical protein
MKLALGVAVLSLLLCASVRAQVNGSDQIVEVATVPICQTEEDVQRYIAIYDGDQDATIANLNADITDPHACRIATVAYLRGPQTGAGWKHDTALAITRILVVGIETERRIHSVRPAVYFAVFSIRELAV